MIVLVDSKSVFEYQAALAHTALTWFSPNSSFPRLLDQAASSLNDVTRTTAPDMRIRTKQICCVELYSVALTVLIVLIVVQINFFGFTLTLVLVVTIVLARNAES